MDKCPSGSKMKKLMAEERKEGHPSLNKGRKKPRAFTGRKSSRR